MNLCSVSARLECAIQSMDSEWGFIFIGTKSGYIHRYSLEVSRYTVEDISWYKQVP